MIDEKDFTDNEIQFLESTYKNLVLGHKDCQGTGLADVAGNQVIDCVCEAVYAFISELVFANIPKNYWGVVVADARNYFFSEEKFKEFQKNKYQSTVFGGLPGAGKTGLLTILSKIFLFEKRRLYFTTAEDLLKLLKIGGDCDILDRIQGSEIIVVDNLDRYVRSAWSDGQIEFFLRSLKDKGKIIFTAVPNLGKNLQSTVSSGLYDFLYFQFESKFVINFSQKKQNLFVSNYFEKSFAGEAQTNFRYILED